MRGCTLAQAPFRRQHFLYFFPEPQGHGSLRPTFDEATSLGDELGAPASPAISRHGGSGGGASAGLGSPSSAGPMRTLKSCSRTISLRRSVISWNMSKASFLYSVSASRCP